MSFLSPLFLTLLLPWAILTWWLLRGRPAEVGVPFLALWRGPIETLPRRERAVRWPPLYLLAILAALLLAILAAVGPVWRGADGEAVSPFILVDRGFTMSAGQRYPKLVAAVAESLRGTRVQHVRWTSVPPPASGDSPIRESTVSEFVANASALGPTAADTAQAVRATIARQLTDEPNTPILAITDQAPQNLDTPDSRVIVVSPDQAARNVGIVRLSARAGQVMLRLRNDSPLTVGDVALYRDGASEPVVVRSISLPPTGEEVNFFFDLAAAEQLIEARVLVGGDEMPADDRAWLVRERSWPTIEARSPLPAALERMIEVYRANRPVAADASNRVLVTTDAPSNSAPSVPTIHLRPATRLLAATTDDDVVVTAHDLTNQVDWPAMLRLESAVASDDPPARFHPVLTVENRVLLAVRGEPTAGREVWIGFDAPNWPRTADYVVFWTNVFDWAGQGGDTLAADSVARLSDDWDAVSPLPQGAEPGLWPGLYRDLAGRYRAVNAPAVRLPAERSSESWQERVAAIADGPAPAGRRFDGFLLLAALLAGLVSACRWPRRNLTVFSADRTV